MISKDSLLKAHVWSSWCGRQKIGDFSSWSFGGARQVMQQLANEVKDTIKEREDGAFPLAAPLAPPPTVPRLKAFG